MFGTQPTAVTVLHAGPQMLHYQSLCDLIPPLNAKAMISQSKSLHIHQTLSS